MTLSITYLFLCFCFLSWIQLVNSLCQAPQKSIYISLKSMSNRDHMDQLFESISKQTTTYNISYRDTISLNRYEITSITYQLRYNNHFQIDNYIDSSQVKVNLGIINLFFQMKYNITDANNQTLISGIGFARSQIDPSSYQKSIIMKDNFVEWQPSKIEELPFSSIITFQNDLVLPQRLKLVLQKMLNNIVVVDDIRPKMSAQINKMFKQKLKEYLNLDHLFSTATIPYLFKSIIISLDHKVKQMSVSNVSKGFVAFIDFGVINSSQINCGTLPQKYNELDYGGLQQFFTMKTIKFILMEAFNKGLFNLTLDKTWQTEVFQFAMGDLANAIPYANIFNSNSSFKIQCGIIDANKTTFSPFDETHMYLQFREQCIIKDNTQDLVRINLHLMYFVKFQAQSDYLSITVDRIQQRLVQFTSLNPKFIIQKNDVALMIITSVLKSMIGRQAFGTKFPLLYRRYPALVLSSQYLIVFDSSQLRRGKIMIYNNSE